MKLNKMKYFHENVVSIRSEDSSMCCYMLSLSGKFGN